MGCSSQHANSHCPWACPLGIYEASYTQHCIALFMSEKMTYVSLSRANA